MNNTFSMLPNFLSEVTVTMGAIPHELCGATARGVLWQAAPGRFLLDMPGVARYLVDAGRTITIDKMKSASQDAIEDVFRMSPLAALLYQRGFVVFHAAAAADSAGAVLLVGDSWAGKSTLLAALLQREWCMLADDLTAVCIDEQGRLLVMPTYPEIALWPDAVKKLGIDSYSMPSSDVNRHIFAMPEKLAASPLPLRAIYCLSLKSNSEVSLVTLAESDCYREVGTYLYNTRIADVLVDRSVYLRCASAIARSVPIYNLCRPRSTWCINALADQISK